jgi:membrane protein DedA with SNARE-associated domain
MLEELITWLVETIFRLGYPGIVLLMAIESSVFPLPSEIVMPPAGVLVAQGRMSGVLVVAAGTMGSILGALGNYALAVWLGRPLLHRYSRYFLVREASLDRAEAFFLRHGEIATFVGRLLPVLRHLVSLPAGIARMHLGRFVAYTALGAAIWCAVLTWVGWYLGTNAAVFQNEDFYRYSKKAVLIMLPLLAMIVGIYAWTRRKTKGTEGSRSA